jgi:SpoVK/Ycf46/Vps4 family AAA+-type ATPase
MPKNIIVNDLSINSLLLNLNNNKKMPLLQWGDKNKGGLLHKKNDDIIEKDLQKSINNSNFIFSMTLDKILKDMEKERERNYKNLSYKNIVNYLDKTSSTSSRADSLNTLLESINKNFNDMQLGNISIPPPPPPDPSWRHRSRRRSVYRIPPLPLALPPPPPPPPSPIKKINIQVEINSLDDILQLCKDYPVKKNVEYNINMRAIHKIEEPLTELNNMIGLSHLKLSIMDQILYFIQNLHKDGNRKSNDFMHTVIYGPPGTGKTEVAKLMGKIFSKMGVLPKNVFKKAVRADLIAGYLGQTAIKTKDMIKDCLGGVLFIDEAYALGNPEKRDSFAKECIDTLCEALSDHKDNLMVIIAGYEEELKSCFFDYNQGLDSRFTWRFKTTDYNAEELKAIFEKKVKDAKWDFKEDIPTVWFERKKEYFKFFGRDMETLLAKTKIAHSRRIFGKDKKERKKLTVKDLEKGFKMYSDNSEVKNRKKDNSAIEHLYL